MNLGTFARLFGLLVLAILLFAFCLFALFLYITFPYLSLFLVPHSPVFSPFLSPSPFFASFRLPRFSLFLPFCLHIRPPQRLPALVENRASDVTGATFFQAPQCAFCTHWHGGARRAPLPPTEAPLIPGLSANSFILAVPPGSIVRQLQASVKATSLDLFMFSLPFHYGGRFRARTRWPWSRTRTNMART